MRKIKRYEHSGENENPTEYDDYLPESLIKEAANIQEALIPLGFEITGFRNKNSIYEYSLQLRFKGPAFAADDSGASADCNE